MSIRKAILKLFGVKEQPVELQYIHKDFCEQGTMVQGVCESHRVYDNVCYPVIHPSCAAYPQNFYMNGCNYNQPYSTQLCGSILDMQLQYSELDGQLIIPFQSHKE